MKKNLFPKLIVWKFNIYYVTISLKLNRLKVIPYLESTDIEIYIVLDR